METAIQSLFNYLRDILYNPDSAALSIDDLPDEMREFANGLVFFANYVLETKNLARALSRGDLDASPASRGNEIAAPLKSLHASLRHLTWQAQRIAHGDYNQRVSFMGNFSDAFNSMVVQLAERENILEEKIIQIEEKSSALEQGNRLLTTLIHHVPQQIFVISSNTGEILLSNEFASEEVERNECYLNDIILLASGKEEYDVGNDIEITYEYIGDVRHLCISRFLLDWHNEKAEVYVIDDITETRNELADMETHVYTDAMTKLNNRAFGMMTLDKWIAKKKRFALVFVDLDNLKYLNDTYGHAEGDIYIIRTTGELAKFSADAVACRIGGDEFMILAPNFGFGDAKKRMIEISEKLNSYKHECDDNFRYNLSYGIVVVEQNNSLPASDILEVADLRMYNNKQRNKRARKISTDTKV